MDYYHLNLIFRYDNSHDILFHILHKILTDQYHLFNNLNKFHIHLINILEIFKKISLYEKNNIIFTNFHLNKDVYFYLKG